MFYGEYKHQLDTNNRFRVPSAYRNDLTGEIVITRGINVKSLNVYSKETFENSYQRDFGAVNIADVESMKIKRKYSSGAMKAVEDKQGRIVLPQNMKEYAEIDKNIVFIGVDDHIEIWSEENWKKEIEE